MSGGSYDYVFRHFDDAASALGSRHPREVVVLAFAAHLRQIATVMHDIEWADSGDTTWTPALTERIRATLSSTTAELTEARVLAEQALHELTAALTHGRGQP